MDVDSNTRMVQASDGSLTITKTVEGDSGTYTCVAKTELDQDEASATLTVQGEYYCSLFKNEMCTNIVLLLAVIVTKCFIWLKNELISLYCNSYN